MPDNINDLEFQAGDNSSVEPVESGTVVDDNGLSAEESTHVAAATETNSGVSDGLYIPDSSNTQQLPAVGSPVPSSEFSSLVLADALPDIEYGDEIVIHPNSMPPISALPTQLQSVVKEVSQALDATPVLVFGTLIAWLSCCVCGQAFVRFKKDNPVAANLWVVPIESSGGGKSAVAGFFFGPLREKLRRMLAQYNKEMDDYYAACEKVRRKDRPPLPPHPPFPIVSQPTLKGLARCLKARSAGVALLVDEISAWFKNIGVSSRRSEQGSQADRFLSLYDCQPWSLERSDQRFSIHIERACVSLFGGIQPERLVHFFSKHAIETGLLPRFTFIRSLFEGVTGWSTFEISQESHKLVVDLTDHLNSLVTRMIGTGEKHLTVDVDPNALKNTWLPWYKNLEAHVLKMLPEHRGLISKQSVQASKIALLLHLAEQVIAQPKKMPEPVILQDTLERALKIADWINIQKFEVVDIVRGESEGNPVYEIKPTEMKIARAILDHIDDIRATNGIVINTKLMEWVTEAGLKIGASALGRACGRLGLSHTKSGVRGVRIDDKTFSTLQSRFRLSDLRKRKIAMTA